MNLSDGLDLGAACDRPQPGTENVPAHAGRRLLWGVTASMMVFQPVGRPRSLEVPVKFRDSFEIVSRWECIKLSNNIIH
jgi:hypothetical protein